MKRISLYFGFVLGLAVAYHIGNAELALNRSRAFPKALNQSARWANQLREELQSY